MKKIIIIIILLAIIIGGVWFFENQKTSVTYTPYTGTDLTLEVKRAFPPEQVKEWQTKIRTTQETIAKFDDKTTVETRINTLFLLYTQQDFLGYYGDAKKTLEQALALEVSHNLLQVYASLLVKMGNREAALPYIDMALRLMPLETNLWRTKIDIQRAIVGPAQLATIEDTYKNALQATKNDINMITLYASYLAELGRHEEAITYWQIAQKTHPANFAVYQAEIDLLKK
ncbi:hypothetical protein E6Q11_00040 [Candidatus Dojkabacteria bacterium]|uniref:Uncharacterized protein n=1 Tax=Candidatus Dojkabacteria bacterium TaxID=2099670 RepID=A0A5C7JD74_9BACT|nr:MAG: hypothetical protein E6Q11_00040 [Candidatus Dojkabacteria bacterium]